MSKRLPIVAIVGRPNVGKSTLFNRIIGKRRALVHDQPGLTRDRHYGHAVYRERPFTVIDTGGYEDATNSPMLTLMREQTLIAVQEADRIVFVTENEIVNDPIDQEIIERLRASGKPFYLVVNKSDDPNRRLQAISDFSLYGLDQVYPISALHGEGVFDLLDDLTEEFSERDDEEVDPRKGPIKIALVGKVNVGKSTLANRLLGMNRMIASDIPGTTRDSIDSVVRVDGEEFILIDTAGIRRRAKTEKGAETLSVHSSFAAIDRADVALLILDATQEISNQDARIAGYILEAGCACAIVLNKWDAVKNRDDYGKYIQSVREEFKFLRWAPILTISASTGQRTHRIWELIRKCAENYRREMSTSDLNRILEQAKAHVSPPITGRKALKINYVTQTGYCPPALSFFVNDPDLLHFSYERYLQNQFRRQLDLEGTPLRFRFRRKGKDRLREDSRGPAKAPPMQRVYDLDESEFEAGVYEQEDE
ncbi:ribosome biogenesis GTPase Der [bacterium]|nr:ribosome biogenesis GTPase Der [bacterium]